MFLWTRFRPNLPVLCTLCENKNLRLLKYAYSLETDVISKLPNKLLSHTVLYVISFIAIIGAKVNGTVILDVAIDVEIMPALTDMGLTEVFKIKYCFSLNLKLFYREG